MDKLSPYQLDGGVVEREHLLVDGWNVVHAWPETRRMMGAQSPMIAGDALIRLLRPLHDLANRRLTIVFDGRGGGLTRDPTWDAKSLEFNVLYTPLGRTADDWIERAVVAVADPQHFIIVTDDQALANCVHAAGGQHWSCQRLGEELGLATKVSRRQIRNSTTAEWKNGLFDGLDAK